MGKLKVELFGRGMAWLDTGTHSAQLNASVFVETVQSRQGLYVSCLEEIAYLRNFITKETLLQQAEKMKNTEYGQYLYRIAKD
jgi:glucose-1-phosphate thymidylyltransferase